MNLRLAALAITAFCAGLFASQSPLEKSGFYLSGDYGITERTATITAGASTATVGKSGINTGAINLGFIKGLGPRFALRLSAGIGSGAETGELLRGTTLLVDTAYEEHDVRVSYGHSYSGLFPDLLYTFAPFSRLFPFLFAGTGFSSYTVSISNKIEDTSRLNGEALQPNGKSSYNKVAINASAGLGGVWMYGYNLGLMLQYKFRYWRPVSYDEEPVLGFVTTKAETHFSHQFEGGLLLTF